MRWKAYTRQSESSESLPDFIDDIIGSALPQPRDMVVNAIWNYPPEQYEIIRFETGIQAFDVDKSELLDREIICKNPGTEVPIASLLTHKNPTVRDVVKRIYGGQNFFNPKKDFLSPYDPDDPTVFIDRGNNY